jgi:hypothetical protein
LWLLRLAVAPASTVSGFRAWVLTETDPGKATKTARFLDLTAERHGPLASIPLDRIARNGDPR